MAYDHLAESITLIESRCVRRFSTVSRRRRFVAMAVDVNGDVAATMFARRGVRCIEKETHVLAFRDQHWHLLGGGGAGGDDDLLSDRPATLPDDLMWGRGAVTGKELDVIASCGNGGVRDFSDGSHESPGRGRWVNYADLLVTSLVASVAVSGRQLPVPWHGHVLVVWSERESPLVMAQDDDMTLAEMQLPARGDAASRPTGRGTDA